MASTIRAFIFDMDDTLARTALIWRDAESHLLRSMNMEWSKELAEQYKGMNTLDVAATVHRLLRPTLRVTECQHILRSRLISNFRDGAIQEISGASDLVRRCRSTGFAMAVASGSPKEAIELTLTRLGIRDEFDVLLSSEQVARGKPHPDVFLEAAARLSVPPESCIVFEDSLIGAQAARAAGMQCIVRPSLANPEIGSFASRTVTGWEVVTRDALTELVGSAQ